MKGPIAHVACRQENALRNPKKVQSQQHITSPEIQWENNQREGSTAQDNDDKVQKPSDTLHSHENP